MLAGRGERQPRPPGVGVGAPPRGVHDAVFEADAFAAGGHDEAACVGRQTQMRNLSAGTGLRRDDGNPSRDALEGDAALMR